jgi:hypothetical protein
MRKFNSTAKWRTFGLPFVLGFSTSEEIWAEGDEIVTQTSFNIYFLLLSFSLRAPMTRRKADVVDPESSIEAKINEAKAKEVIIPFSEFMTLMREEAKARRQKRKQEGPTDASP